jgi:hypothetical protein
LFIDANETLNKLINQLSTAATGNSTTNPTPSVDMTLILQNTLLQSLQAAVANALNSTTSQTATTTNNNEMSGKLTQAITTIATQLHQHQTQPTTDATGTVPEYRPTPIAELERRRRVQHPAIKPKVKNGNILSPFGMSFKNFFCLSRKSRFRL